MISFQQFRDKWNNRGIDFDGYYGDQCMDLMHQYCVEVLGLTDGRILAAPSAKQVFLNFDNVFGNEHFDKINNSPTGIPNNGDIMFFGVGQYGHVSIYIDGSVMTFNSFDQNWPVGSKCHIQVHDYNQHQVLGWLRFKGKLQDQQALIDQLRKERDENWNKYQEEKRAHENDIKAKNNTITSLNDTINSLTSKIDKAREALK